MEQVKSIDQQPSFLTKIFYSPTVTVARLLLDSYFRSGWMWGEFVLVLVFFAALFFPFMENVAYFYGTSIWDLSAIAILGTAIMVRQSTSARTYVVLSRLTSRSAYSRGLMLATGVLRIPVFLFFMILVLLTHRLLNPTVGTMFIGAIGLLPVTILASSLTVVLSSPIGTRRKRMIFLAWVALALFSISPIIQLPDTVLSVLSIVRIPLAPIATCYLVSINGTLPAISLPGFAGIALYIVALAFLAGYWLEQRELLLY